MVIKNTKSDDLGNNKKFAKKDTSYSSFWLYNKYGDMDSEHYKDSFINFFDDKNTLSEFPPNVAKNIINYWSEKGDKILDPFAGRTRALVSWGLGREYFGFEISKPAAEYINHKIDKMFEDPLVEIFNDDCKNIESYGFQKEYFNFIFTCPPYWDLEKYGNEAGQLGKSMKYETFLQELKRRLDICGVYLEENKFMAIVIGDFRKKKKYYSLHSKLIELYENDEQFCLHDVIVIQNIPFHTAAFYFGQNKKQKRTSKSHEYLLIFKKKEKKELNTPKNLFML